jgi:hypothetical protein
MLTPGPAIPAKQSASSVADVLGWSAIVFNAVLAGLKASTLNIGAIFALAFARHSISEPTENARDQVATLLFHCCFSVREFDVSHGRQGCFLVRCI